MAPVVTIDGPSGCGKGTIAHRLATRLGWHVLDSGAIYRAIAWCAMQQADHTAALEAVVRACLQPLPLKLVVPTPGASTQVFLGDVDITEAIRTEACGMVASKVATMPFVRESVLSFQRDFCQPPGLVADGRDMGTVVFPEATVKFYLDASQAVRAFRRQRQLAARGLCVALEEVTQDLANRDAQDAARSVAPLQRALDAIYIDTTDLSVEAVFVDIMAHMQPFIV